MFFLRKSIKAKGSTKGLAQEYENTVLTDMESKGAVGPTCDEEDKPGKNDSAN
jgi:hypothetical protein